jgi:putative ABC transport system permease protein
VLSVALAAAFTATLGSFLVFVRTQVETRAAGDVDVDWQVQLTQDARLANVLNVIQKRPGIVRYDVVGYGDVTGFEASTGGTVQTTGSGKIVGLGPGYRSDFPAEVRTLIGASEGILLAQQTAANLRAGPGDTISAVLADGERAAFRVDGVVDLPRADSFFQKVGAAAGAGPQAPPDNVLIVPMTRWHSIFGVGNGMEQLHVRLKRHLPRDPAAAFAELLTIKKQDEAALAGTVTIGDNLAARLDGARTDAAYGQLLFGFLGIPGIALAAAMVVLVARSGTERRRRDQALLRARGAGPATILSIAGAEGLVAGVVGAVVGVGVAAVAAQTLWHLSAPRLVLPFALGASLGLLTSVAAVLVPSVRDVRRTSVRDARLIARATEPPATSRAVAAIALCVVAGFAVWYATRRGYDVVVAPEGIPTVSVSYLALAGPMLAWPAALMALAVAGRTLLSVAAGPAARLTTRWTGGIAAIVPAWLRRVRSLSLRPVVLIALATGFAVSTSIFDTSFAQQSRVNAELTNGAAVSAEAAPGVDLTPSAAAVRRVPGVAEVALMRHRFAYVGNDLQDLYGVTPSIQRATTVSDAYFASGHARIQLADLQHTPDGIFVAEETVVDYQLRPGDLIRIRVLDARTHRYVAKPFHLLGVIREFPTAPTDSFLVANASYIRDITHSSAEETMLVRTDGRSPRVVANGVRRAVPASARVQDIDTTRRIVASGLVAVDAHGITQIEMAFGLLIALGGVAMLLALAVVERRRSFVILRTLRVTARQVAALAAAEAGSVVVIGTLAGTAFGGAIGWILVKVLRGVFDPPPQHPVIPWPYLGLLVAAIAATAALATGVSVASTARLDPSELRRSAL